MAPVAPVARPAPPPPSRLDAEDATLIHVPRASLSGAEPTPSASASPLVPQPTMALPAPSAAGLAFPPGLAPLPPGARPMSSPDLSADRTAKISHADLAAMGGGAHANMFAAPQTDPGESISSINVVRGGDALGADQRFRSDPTQLRPARQKTGIIAMFGALGLVALIAVGVIVSKSGGAPETSAAASKPSTQSPATAARGVGAATSTATATADAAPTASASASAPTSASATSKPVAAATGAARAQPRKGKRTTGDPVKDLGSGL